MDRILCRLKALKKWMFETKRGIYTSIILFMMCGSIPRVYSLFVVEFPAQQDIHYTQGVFIYKKEGKRRFYPLLKQGKEEIAFSCKAGEGSDHNCSITYEQFREWNGKNAEIAWFWQPMMPFVKSKRMVQLKIEGEVKVTPETIKRHINNVRESGLSYFLGWAFFTALFIFIVRKMASLKGKGERV